MAPILAGACCCLLWAGPSPVLAEVPVGAVPRHSWPGPTVGFPGLVPCKSRLRSLWVHFPTNPGWGLLLAFVGWSLTNPG